MLARLVQQSWVWTWLFYGLLASAKKVEEPEDGMKRIHLRTHSLQPPYLDSDMQSRWWDFGGNTVIRTDSYIRLAADRPSEDGWVFSRVPLTATNWEIEVEFKIHGKGHLYGDGMAMWLTKQRAQPGTVFGHTDNFEGLGLFFDTYKNNRPGVVFPYVMAMMGDGQTPYDKASDGKANELAGCSARGIRNANVPTKARLTHFADKNFTVALKYKNEDDWTQCFSVENVKFPSVAYLGFSAETGELTDNFDIIKVESRNVYNPNPGSKVGKTGSSKNSYRKTKGGSGDSDSSGGTWFGMLFKFVLFGIAVTVAYVGYTAYRSNRRSRF